MPRGVVIPGAIALLLILGGAGWFIWRGRSPMVRPAQPTPLVDDGIEVRLSNVTLQGISGGKLVWEVQAERFDMVKNRPLLRVTGLKRVAVLNGRKTELTLRADLLERNTATGDIELMGRVNVEGNGLRVTTQYARWDARRESLAFPQQITAVFGDYTLSCLGGVTYDVKASTLRGTGATSLSTKGSVLRSGGIVVEVLTQRFVLLPPVAAELNVASMDSWLQGKHQPAVPKIPPGIQARYRDYLRTRPATGSPR